MRNIFEYLFYSIYHALNRKFFFYGFTKKEYYAAGFLGFLFSLNIISLVLLFNKELLNGEKGNYMVLIGIIVTLMCSVYFPREKKLVSLEKKYKHEFSKHRFRSILITILYTLLSFVFFVMII
ncbi:MAG: hypothetical protein AAFO07_03195 [Bacteroidota bacterium]